MALSLKGEGAGRQVREWGVATGIKVQKICFVLLTVCSDAPCSMTYDALLNLPVQKAL